MATKQYIIAFLIGLSGSLLTASYLGWGFHATDHEKLENLHFEILVPLVAITLGIANVVNIYLGEKYNWFIGLVVGLLFSTYGIYLNFPEKYFNITTTQARIIAMVLYSFLFSFYMQFMNKKLL